MIQCFCLQMKRSSLEDLISGKHLVELEPQPVQHGETVGTEMQRLKVRCQVLGLHGKIPGQVGTEFALASLHTRKGRNCGKDIKRRRFAAVQYPAIVLICCLSDSQAPQHCSAPSCHLVSTAIATIVVHGLVNAC